MKYFSEKTNKNYDTVEELEKAEKALEVKEAEQAQPKIVDNDRKAAAAKVDEAINKVVQARADKQTKEVALKEKADEICAKYEKLHRQLEEQQRAEEKDLQGEYRALEKDLSVAITDARKEMAEFCKKYGAYHYSVNAKNADIFPFLWGIRQSEKLQNVFDLFGDFWNLF